MMLAASADGSNDGVNRSPEAQGNWCGISNISVIEAYISNDQGVIMSQQQIYNLLSNNLPPYQPVSPWGTANPVWVDGHYDTPYVAADIAADGGTDPRSIAYGLYTITPVGYYYHNYIYPAWNGVDHATRNFASDFGNYGLNNPISVTVNGGKHSVVIAGVWSIGDPSVDANPANLQAVRVWDPWYFFDTDPTDSAYHLYNSTGERQDWAISDWEGRSVFWGLGYDTGQNGNWFDPDPSTPINYYNPPPAHWTNNYVTIEQDLVSSQSPNIALDNYGNPVAHN